MSNKSRIWYIAIFMVLIFCVGVLQAVYEKKRGESVQMLDLFVDTFGTPVQRAKTLAGLFAKIEEKLVAVTLAIHNAPADSSGSWESAQAQEVAEEALFLLQDFKKSVLAINRHIQADSTEPEFAVMDSLRIVLDELYEFTMDSDREGAVDRLQKTVPIIAGMKEHYRFPSAMAWASLAWNAFWLETGFNQRYLRAWENEMEESSLAANTLRPPWQFFRYAALHDLGDKAVLGKDGWFFYRPGFDYLTYPHVRDKRSLPDTTTNIMTESAIIMKDDPIKCITGFRDQLAQRDIDLLVVIVPGKPSIYPDLINPKISPDQAASFSHSVKIIAELREEGVDVVDLFTAFAQERKNDHLAGDSLYLQKDTHWRARGLRLCASLVAQKVKEYSWYDTASQTTEYVMDSMVIDRIGDVGTMTALPDFKVREMGMQFAVEPTKCFKIWSVTRDSTGAEIGRREYRDEFNRSRILVLGDSFSRIYQTDAPRGAGWIAHLAKELSQPVASIISDGGASTLVREKLARATNVLKGKKLVVWEFVERDLRFGAEGWKFVALD